MSEEEQWLRAFLEEPDPTTQDEYRAAFKRWEGKVSPIYFECLTMLAVTNDWRLEDT